MEIRLKPVFRALFLINSLLLAVPSYAQAQSEPVTVVSHVDIVPDAYRAGAEESAERLFRGEIAASREDKGMVSYAVFQQIGALNHFTIVETWRDARAYALHVGSRHTVRFRQGIEPFLGSPFDARMLQKLR